MTDRVNVDMVDLYVDLTYGALLMVGIVSMMVFNQYLAAVTFGVGVVLAYAVHFGWRMARFDPDAADRIEQAVDEKVEDHVGDMADEVKDTVEEEVGKNVAEQVGQAQSEIEQTVEEKVEETVNGDE